LKIIGVRVKLNIDRVLTKKQAGAFNFTLTPIIYVLHFAQCIKLCYSIFFIAIKPLGSPTIDLFSVSVCEGCFKILL